jgi:VIT1/CCC1 family predicted Fe2+/Mn2+ transporter
MTFTSAFRSFATVPDATYLHVVYSALFCCIAWGVADGSFYVWERKYNIKTENEIIDLSKSEQKRDAAIPLIQEELDDTILRNVDSEKRIELYQVLLRYLSVCGQKKTVSTRDSLNIVLGTLLVSTAAGVIVVLPFFLIGDLSFALDISNWLGISLLFIIGYYRTNERNLSGRVRSSFGTAIIGIVIAVITILLGG